MEGKEKVSLYLLLVAWPLFDRSIARSLIWINGCSVYSTFLVPVPPDNRAITPFFFLFLFLAFFFFMTRAITALIGLSKYPSLCSLCFVGRS